MREVGRTAEHRHPQTVIFGDPPGSSPIGVIGELKKPAVELQPVDVERGGQFNPLADRHRSVDAQRIQKCFGKGGELGHRSAPDERVANEKD